MMQVRYADNRAQKELKRAPEYRQYLADKELMKQVRYADTPAQKELKRVTAERRQFRTNEYNIGAYGTADVGIHPSIYHQGSWNRRIGSGSSAYVSSNSQIRSHSQHVNRSFAPRTFGRSSIEGSSLSEISPGAGGYTSKYGNYFHSPHFPGHAEHDD